MHGNERIGLFSVCSGSFKSNNNTKQTQELQLTQEPSTLLFFPFSCFWCNICLQSSLHDHHRCGGVSSCSLQQILRYLESQCLRPSVFIFASFTFLHLLLHLFLVTLNWSLNMYFLLSMSPSMLPVGLFLVLYNVHVILSWKTKHWTQAVICSVSHLAAQLCLLAHLFSNRSKATMFF